MSVGRPVSTVPWAIGAIAIIAAGLVFLYLLVASIGSAPPLGGISGPGPISSDVSVSSISTYSPDDACGLNGEGLPGFQTSPGSDHATGWTVPGPTGRLPCTIASVTTSTPGFSVSAPTPATYDSLAAMVPIVIYCGAPFSGVLNLTVE